MKYKFLEHTADVKFQAFGNKIEKCFENDGYVLKEIICNDKIKNKTEKEIFIKPKDFENLFYNFLIEFLTMRSLNKKQYL